MKTIKCNDIDSRKMRKMGCTKSAIENAQKEDKLMPFQLQEEGNVKIVRAVILLKEQPG